MEAGMARLGGEITVFADDMAIALMQFFRAFPLLIVIMLLIGRATNLWLHPGKCVILPLWKFREEAGSQVVA
eukprot:14990477-Alexandrium_andersonii.AAC.1